MNTKNTMNTSPVIHPVSNSLAHPENMASNFMASYNVSFDLCGKRIALVNIVNIMRLSTTDICL